MICLWRLPPHRLDPPDDHGGRVAGEGADAWDLYPACTHRDAATGRPSAWAEERLQSPCANQQILGSRTRVVVDHN